ncbi:hypothetical protein M440DRAFT_1183672 [Trichoderma longibrachiatum ATCC 18648]|uniref:Uncharacterized protein n=1 Tax=Trichoderma longibrachiatum ATCC 18648 TaxID=983965 RepID=A0A2T4C965_TRILO|nr:hypothetical protein M440DRAFT_1183672 [Trichoderma longibrachiatum ATCC 18648]
MTTSTTSSSTNATSNTLSLPSPPSSSSSSSSSPSNPTRPSFNSHKTQDRLREGETPYVLFRTETSNLQPGRKSVFKEIGLLDDDDIAITPDVNLSIVAATTSDEDDSSASGVSLQSPITPPPTSSSTVLDSKQPVPFPPLRDMSVKAGNALGES